MPLTTDFSHPHHTRRAHLCRTVSLLRLAGIPQRVLALRTLTSCWRLPWLLLSASSLSLRVTLETLLVDKEAMDVALLLPAACSLLAHPAGSQCEASFFVTLLFPPANLPTFPYTHTTTYTACTPILSRRTGLVSQADCNLRVSAGIVSSADVSAAAVVYLRAHSPYAHQVSGAAVQARAHALPLPLPTPIRFQYQLKLFIV